MSKQSRGLKMLKKHLTAINIATGEFKERLLFYENLPKSEANLLQYAKLKNAYCEYMIERLKLINKIKIQ